MSGLFSAWVVKDMFSKDKRTGPAGFGPMLKPPSSGAATHSPVKRKVPARRPGTPLGVPMTPLAPRPWKGG